MRTHFANAQLYDGTLSSPIRADLLIEDDRIVQVSSSIRSRADTTLDCTGLRSHRVLSTPIPTTTGSPRAPATAASFAPFWSRASRRR